MGKELRKLAGKQARTSAILAGSIMLISIISCGRQHDASSGLKHDMNEPVRQANAWQWHELNDEVFTQVFLPFQMAINDEDSVGFLKDEHPLAKRAQDWLDRFDAAIRKEHGAELANTPKPKILVRADAQPNAFVMPVPVCLQTKVLVTADQDRRQVLDQNLVKLKGILLTSDGALAPDPGSGKLCVQRQVSTAELKDFVAWMNSELVGCQLKVVGTDDKPEVSLGSKCQLDTKLRNFGTTEKLVYLPTANRVNINIALTLLMTEESFAAILGHELGHYYRSHMSAADEGGKYNFFYKLAASNPDRLPTADPSLAALGKKVRGLSIPTERYLRRDGQLIRSELLLPATLMTSLVSSLQQCSDAEPCNKACEEFSELLTQEETTAKLRDFPFSPLAANGAQTLKDLETKALSCLEKVSIGTDGEKSGTTLTLKNVNDALSIDPSLASIFATFTPSGKLSEVLQKAGAHLDLAVATLRKPLDEAAAMKLGYYTAEQEADELSIEWLADIGVEPTAALEAELALGRYTSQLRRRVGSPSDPLDVEQSKCEALAKNNWLDTRGQPFFVPIYDFIDPHHSACYRAFNISREIKAHGIEVNPAAGALVFNGTETWTELKALASAVVTELLNKAPEGESPAPLAFADMYTLKANARLNAAYAKNAHLFKSYECSLDLHPEQGHEGSH